MVFLSQSALESVFAQPRTIEHPHNKTIFFNEISDGLNFVLNQMEPLVLVNVAIDKVFAFVEHGRTVSLFVRSIAFLNFCGRLKSTGLGNQMRWTLLHFSAYFLIALRKSARSPSVISTKQKPFPGRMSSLDQTSLTITTISSPAGFISKR